MRIGTIINTIIIVLIVKITVPGVVQAIGDIIDIEGVFKSLIVIVRFLFVVHIAVICVINIIIVVVINIINSLIAGVVVVGVAV